MALHQEYPMTGWGCAALVAATMSDDRPAPDATTLDRPDLIAYVEALREARDTTRMRETFGKGWDGVDQFHLAGWNAALSAIAAHLGGAE